jgi:hypothetical protein
VHERFVMPTLFQLSQSRVRRCWSATGNSHQLDGCHHDAKKRLGLSQRITSYHADYAGICSEAWNKPPNGAFPDDVSQGRCPCPLSAISGPQTRLLSMSGLCRLADGLRAKAVWYWGNELRGTHGGLPDRGLNPADKLNRLTVRTVRCKAAMAAAAAADNPLCIS